MQWQDIAAARQLYLIQRDWHPWFAWRPVRFEGSMTWAWLETVLRRVEYPQGYRINYYRPGRR